MWLARVAAKSKIIANVRTEYVPEADINKYMASRRFNLFQKLDTLAATLPPSRRTPSTGGVNFALLPNEDLRGLAKRVTGDPDNWKVIADQNGLTSPTDVTPFQTIWVPDGADQGEAAAELLQTRREGAESGCRVPGFPRPEPGHRM